MISRDHPQEHTTNLIKTATMVVDLPGSTAAWIWCIDTTWGASGLAHVNYIYEAAIEAI